MSPLPLSSPSPNKIITITILRDRIKYSAVDIRKLAFSDPKSIPRKSESVFVFVFVSFYLRLCFGLSCFRS